MNLSVQLFRAGVPDSDPIREAIIGRAALSLDREIARVNKQYGIEVNL
ncbi:hypothetical protein [Vreelandella aquamarina]|nr:hypothetical protein [Halomonas axialensis]